MYIVAISSPNLFHIATYSWRICNRFYTIRAPNLDMYLEDFFDLTLFSTFVIGVHSNSWLYPSVTQTSTMNRRRWCETTAQKKRTSFYHPHHQPWKSAGQRNSMITNGPPKPMLWTRPDLLCSSGTSIKWCACDFPVAASGKQDDWTWRRLRHTST